MDKPHIHASSLIYPLFVTKAEDRPITGFAPNMQWGAGPDGNFKGLVDHLTLVGQGLRCVMLSGVVEHKDSSGTMADAAYPRCPMSARAVEEQCYCEAYAHADVCLCEYTDHGHCGMLRTIGNCHEAHETVIDNGKGVRRLADVAVAYAQAGAHCVCPSDMMDGRVGAMRQSLDSAGFSHVTIMSYTSKKAGCRTRRFVRRSSPHLGQSQTIPADCWSGRAGAEGARADVAEGADYVLVKPALFYGDIIRRFAETAQPVACYVVSGEYKMLKDYGEACGCLRRWEKATSAWCGQAQASSLRTLPLQSLSGCPSGNGRTGNS